MVRAVFCFLALAAALRADIQTVSASALFADTLGSGTYSVSAALAPFDTTLGTLTSVDLTLSADYKRTEHWERSDWVTTTPYLASVSMTTTGTSSDFGTQTGTQSFSLYVNWWNGCGQWCTAVASLQFGGEQTLAGTDLAQFENGTPVPLSASASTTFVTTGALWCCVPYPNLLSVQTLPYPYPPLRVYGYLNMDVSATYTYKPLDAVPEPRTWLGMILALSIMMAAARWRS